ncbi:MAG: PilT/PilU family type 4a pilus ATPase [Opitutales bacterium]
MNGEIELFVSRLKLEGILDTQTARKLRRIAGPDADVVTFGEKVIEYVCDDFELIQKLLDQSSKAYDEGARTTHDPFEEDEFGQPAHLREDMHPAEDGDHHGLTRAPFQEVTNPDAEAASALSTESAAPSESAPADETAEVPKRTRLSLRDRGQTQAPHGGDGATPVAPDAARGEPPAAEPNREDADPAAPGSPRGDLNDLDLSELATLAAQSVQRSGNTSDGGAVTAAGASARPGGPPHARVTIEAPAAPQTPEELQRYPKPPEAVIEAEGIKPTQPNFAALDPGSGLPALQGFLLSTLAYARSHGFSDLHLSAGARPYVRRFGELSFLGSEPLSPELSEKLNTCLLSDHQQAYFRRFRDYDFCLSLSSGQRFRANLLMHRDGFKGTYRLIPGSVPGLHELGFGDYQPILEKLLSYHNGLLLIGGAVGSGKTSTLAALVDFLNRTRSDHIVCVEDPIEIIHNSQQCSVTQRGVGPHTASFRRALKGALRQDPDVIVIGEMRNLETIEMAISASETGHLVLATLHTSDAANTLNRILDVFPPSQQSQIRAMVSESLRGIICQKLLPGVDGGVALACEILINNRAVSAMIKEGKQQGLGNVMETGKREGMVQMDASILDLWRKGRISGDIAAKYLKNEVLRRQVTVNTG